ncbi:LLM class flavin-dependent oxidoreductase [Rhodococcoides fascians]|uniref:LLM class flavin-dependent oxidoreductase n=1 Tax=Nocardiaceae TaxID=85025 RepID=UPI00050CD572
MPVVRRLRRIGHRRRLFTVPDIHLVEPSPQRAPVIFQAGASTRGVRFAAQNAEVIFVGAPTEDTLSRRSRV